MSLWYQIDRPDTEAEPAADTSAAALGSGSSLSSSAVSIRRLEIFNAVAQRGSVTGAARALCLSQPTVSQQLAALEAETGSRLFDRSGSRLALTEFGITFLQRSSKVLNAQQELLDVIRVKGRGQAVTLRIAGIPSVMRRLLPAALRELRDLHPATDFDLQEASPTDALELLQSRRVSYALIAETAQTIQTEDLTCVALRDDPYYLITPQQLQLSDVRVPEADLAPKDLELLQSSIQFAYDTPSGRQWDAWFSKAIAGSRTTVRARSFEAMIELVRAGMGVCVAPGLAIDALTGLNCYAIDVPPRKILALTLPQHAHSPDSQALSVALQRVARSIVQPNTAAPPAFLAKSSAP